MNDDPTTDSTPAWFTPPDHGSSAPPRRSPVQAPPSPPPPVPAEGFHVTAPPVPAEGVRITRPGDTFAVTRPGETFAVTPPSSAARPAATAVDFWPVDAPAEAATPEAPAPEEWPIQRGPLSPLTTAPPPSTTALAPPTPLVRPIITVTPPSRTPGSRPTFEEPPDDDGGGRGWRVRAGHAAAPEDTPQRPTGLLLDPATAGDEPPALVMPRMSWEKPERRHRPTRRYVLFGVGLFALCGLVALTLTTVGRFAHGIQQPQTIGGLDQITTPSVQTTLDSLSAYEQSLGASNVVTGAYGAQDQTQMMLVVVQSGSLANGGTPAVLQGFVRGIATGATSVGWTLDPAKVTTTTIDNTTFECDQGPASANGGAILSMCAWTDPGVAGAVVDITGQPLTDVLNEAVQARAASEH